MMTVVEWVDTTNGILKGRICDEVETLIVVALLLRNPNVGVIVCTPVH